MLIPQFSIRWLLALTAVCAVIFSIVGLAVRGHAWAAGVSIGIGSLVVLGLLYGALFAMVWIFSGVTSSLRGRRARLGQSPFRTESVAGSPTSPFREVPVTPIVLD